MRLDARVSMLKFRQEIERIEKENEMLRTRGVIIEKIEYPVVEAVFLPRENLKLHLHLNIPPEAPLPPGVILPPDGKLEMFFDLPFTSRAFGVRISLDDFDQRAPSVVFCDPCTWEVLPYQMLPSGNIVGDDGKAVNAIIQGHPYTKRPFLCMRGIREYHEHPQHSGDDWLQYRRHIGLLCTIGRVWKACVLNSSPHLIPHNFPQNLIMWATPTVGAK